MSARTKKTATVPVKNAQASYPHPITLLPFVKDTKGDRNFWTIDGRTGDWGNDCLRGEAMAQLAIGYMKRTRFVPLLTFVVKDMVASGSFGGVEVGFITEFAKAAIRYPVA